jgi:lysocardiolipin and lysophospholipid acyltransferase
MTIGYPGIPAAGYSQSYYTLSSIYLSSCPPPIVHVHIRRYPLSEVPIGFFPAVLPRVEPAATTFVEPSSVVPVLTADELDKSATQEDRNKFDEWLRTRWQEKDELLEQFYKEGKFGTGDQMKVGLGVIEIPLKLRGIDDYLEIFACFVGAYVGWRVIKFGVDSLLSVDFF